jgi:hypothetical protein
MSGINPVAGSTQSSPGPEGVIGALPNLSLARTSERTVEWPIPHPSEIGTVVNGEFLSGEGFLRALRLDPLLNRVLEETLASLRDAGRAQGKELSKSEFFELRLTLDELLSNAIMHGVLGVGSRERMNEIRQLSGDILANELRTLKLSSEQPSIRIDINANSERLEIVILDGGKMTPELFEELRKQRREHDLKLLAAEKLVERQAQGETLTPDEENVIQTTFVPTGRGLLLTESYPQQIEGLHGGVRLTRPLNADASS